MTNDQLRVALDRQKSNPGFAVRVNLMVKASYSVLLLVIWDVRRIAYVMGLPYGGDRLMPAPASLSEDEPSVARIHASSVSMLFFFFYSASS